MCRPRWMVKQTSMSSRPCDLTCYRDFDVPGRCAPALTLSCHWALKSECVRWHCQHHHWGNEHPSIQTPNILQSLWSMISTLQRTLHICFLGLKDAAQRICPPKTLHTIWRHSKIVSLQGIFIEACVGGNLEGPPNLASALEVQCNQSHCCWRPPKAVNAVFQLIVLQMLHLEVFGVLQSKLQILDEHEKMFAKL